MGKFLLLAAFAAFVWWLFRNRNRPEDGAPPSTPPPEEAMVACAHCGVYLPLSESLGDADVRYCSAAHQSAGPRQEL